VTQVLQPWCDFSAIRPEVLANAARRGTDVHAACLCKVQGLWMPAVPEDCAGYVESFRSWMGVVEEVVAVEVTLADGADLRVIGHPDLICRIRGDRALSLVDIKTPASTSRSWALQLAAYRHLACTRGGYEVGRSFALRLSKDGGRPIVDEPSPSQGQRHLSLFRNARALWAHFNE
jgi:hypothetical protein